MKIDFKKTTTSTKCSRHVSNLSRIILSMVLTKPRLEILKFSSDLVPFREHGTQWEWKFQRLLPLQITIETFQTFLLNVPPNGSHQTEFEIFEILGSWFVTIFVSKILNSPFYSMEKQKTWIILKTNNRRAKQSEILRLADSALRVPFVAFKVMLTLVSFGAFVIFLTIWFQNAPSSILRIILHPNLSQMFLLTVHTKVDFRNFEI